MSPFRKRTHARRDQRGNESGAAIVEMALVAPFVVALILGILEGGIFMLDYLSLEESTRDTSRELAIHGTAADGDVLVLDAVQTTLDNIAPDLIQRVVVYHADDRDSEPPDSCKTGPVPGSAADRCTIYTTADFALDETTLVCAWCPADRVPGEQIGLWIQIDYESTTGLFPGRTIANSSVQPLERDSS